MLRRFAPRRRSGRLSRRSTSEELSEVLRCGAAHVIPFRSKNTWSMQSPLFKKHAGACNPLCKAPQKCCVLVLRADAAGASAGAARPRSPQKCCAVVLRADAASAAAGPERPRSPQKCCAGVLRADAADASAGPARPRSPQKCCAVVLRADAAGASAGATRPRAPQKCCAACSWLLEQSERAGAAVDVVQFFAPRPPQRQSRTRW